MANKIPIEKRFWNHVAFNEPNQCWIWTGARWGKFYGMVVVDNKRMLAHRVAYEISIGPIPEGFDIMHTCDNGLCVNPQHLLAGTHTDNMRDKMRKGRGNHQHGEINHAAKLTAAQVQEIRQMLARGMKQCDIARQFNVTQPTISYIHTGKFWNFR